VSRNAAIAAAAEPLARHCGTNPAILCRLVWDISHSGRAADVTSIYLVGPVYMALRVALVLLIALVLRTAALRLIRRITARATGASEGLPRAGHERRQQRASAMASLLGNAASVTIFTIAVMTVLGYLGLNLAPILASAGVLGIALGFGAQNLVQDFLAGIFILLEDQYGVGDVIDVAGISGTVEAVSLRITRLRDISGVIWHIRNGTIKKSGNESHGWARAVVDVPVPASREAGRIRELMASAATAMWREPAWHEVILERPEVWGIQELTADSMLMRVTARTAPLRQWEVARELRQRLKESMTSPPGGDSGSGDSGGGNSGGGSAGGGSAGGGSAGGPGGRAGAGAVPRQPTGRPGEPGGQTAAEGQRAEPAARSGEPGSGTGKPDSRRARRIRPGRPEPPPG